MTRSDCLVRLVSAAFRKYSRDPDTRAYASRHMVQAALALCAQHNDLGEVALMCAETLATLKQQDRLTERSVG